MPELPEVETVARELASRVEGATVRKIVIARADYVTFDGPARVAPFAGRTIATVLRHGKRLEIGFAPAGFARIHLGMSGSLLIEPTARAPSPHTHVRIDLGDRGEEIRLRDPRRFGGLHLDADGTPGSPGTGAADAPRNFGPLGPDALRVRLPEFRRILDRRAGLKATLLDQRRIAGLGNIYVDEILHGVELHPAATAGELTAPESAALLRKMRVVLRRAIHHGGSTLRDYRRPDGESGAYQARHRVYGRGGQPCRRCGGSVVRRVLAGRSTHFCPECQRKR